MKKFSFLMTAFALFALLSIPMGMRGQTRDVETFTFSEMGYGNADDVTLVEGDNVTLTFDSGTNANNSPKYYNTGTAVRMYTGNTLEVALNNQEGETRITAIDFTFVSANYTGSLQNWTGSETSVSFTNTATTQARIQVITVTFSEGGVAPTTYTVTYKANVAGVADIVDTYTEGATVTMRPANTFTYEGHTFSEWNTDANGDGDAYEAGETVDNIQANFEVYAIWTENPTSGDEQWVLTNLADLTETDVFVIVGNNGSDFAMSNNNGTTVAPSAVAVTVANNEITGTVASTIQWNISGNATDGYVFYPNGSTATWLYCTSSNNGVRVGTNEANTFKMEATSGYLVHQGTSRYIGIYNSSDWRCYTSINTNIQGQTFAFYKKVTGGVIPPSISADNVSIEYNAVSGSIAYTINNGVAGGTLTAATDSDWLTLGQGTASPISFTCTANTGAAERTATVVLTYTYNRTTATANVIVTQAGNPDVINNISDITATNISYAVIGTVVAKSARGLVFGDGTGYVYYYNASYDQTAYNIGDVKKISGSMSSYNHVFQFPSTATIEDASVSNYNNTPAIQVLEAAGILAYNEGLHLSDYVQIEGTLIKSGSYYNLEVAGLENTASISYPTTAQAEELNALENKTVIVKGYFAGVSSGHFNVMLESIEEITVPVIHADNITLDYNATSAAIGYTITNPVAGTALLASTTATWISNINVGDTVVTFTTTVNESNEDRIATIILSYTGAANKEVTVTQGHYVIDYATLPFEFDGGRADIATTTGLTQGGLDSDYGSSPKLKFNTTDDYVLLHFNEAPGTLTFDIKAYQSQGSWEGTFAVMTSSDGISYTEKASYSDISTTTETKTISDLASDVRYIKWIYTKVTGNVALGNIKLYEFGGGPVIETYDLTVEPFENLEIFTFVGGDESEMALEGAGTIQVAEGDQVLLSVSAEEGYVMQSLIVDGVEHVNDISDDLTYTFTMPGHNVTINATAVEDVPFEPATYTLATTIESGKTYIIVGSKTIDEETNYFAMGEQRYNNRGGVAISVDGTTATVETADVYEFVVTALEENGFYSIYDNRTPGYLYAAGPSNNYLRTEPELDTIGNGDWEIGIDSIGQFSIIASHSSNRNVMQFNYNGGNTLFSCYGSASQSPVYLYVKNEVPTTLTQTVTLAAGSNYFSTYVDVSLDDLKAALVATGNTNIVIKSRTQTHTYNPSNGRWTGRLTWDVTNMYIITVGEACEITLQGMPINPAEHPVTIKNGSNYIAFPLDESMSVTNAFAGFAVNGDVIKSRNSTSTYVRNRWSGGVQNLTPGQGYIYVSGQTEDRILTFPQ